MSIIRCVTSPIDQSSSRGRLQTEKVFLNLAGEFLVAAELNRRSILCSVTYGASKSADLFAFTETTGRVVRIEVKTTKKTQWPVGERGLSAGSGGTGHLWVFVLLPPPLDALTPNNAVRGQFAPRFFVLTAQEVEVLARARDAEYRQRYQAKHGVPYAQPGVPSITVEQAAPYESNWDKVRSAVLDVGTHAET